MSETAVMTITDFLLARIAEDEARAKRATGHRVNWLRMCDSIAAQTDADVGHFVNDHDPARVLAECEAKRRIVEALDAGNPIDEWMSALTLEWVAKALAAMYADHADYRDEWRP